MQNGRKFTFHICENPIICQTIIKYILCTRHAIWSEAPKICVNQDLKKLILLSKNLSSTKTSELLIMILIQIHHPLNFSVIFFIIS